MRGTRAKLERKLGIRYDNKTTVRSRGEGTFLPGYNGWRRTSATPLTPDPYLEERARAKRERRKNRNRGYVITSDVAPNLHKLSIRKLQHLAATEYGISGAYRMRKAELIERIGAS